jgi:hypothetical protein
MRYESNGDTIEFRDGPCVTITISIYDHLSVISKFNARLPNLLLRISLSSSPKWVRLSSCSVFCFGRGYSNTQEYNGTRNKAKPIMLFSLYRYCTNPRIKNQECKTKKERMARETEAEMCKRRKRDATPFSETLQIIEYRISNDNVYAYLERILEIDAG